jgi:hypothetical protein
MPRVAELVDEAHWHWLLLKGVLSRVFNRV